jgi:beta-mannosidase
MMISNTGRSKQNLKVKEVVKTTRRADTVVLNKNWEFAQETSTSITLDDDHGGWELLNKDGIVLKLDEFRAANVPGCVHTDLLRHELIDDPFYRLNEHQLQWIDKVNWIYRTTFDVPATMAARKHIRLAFEGLDTFAQVRLNGQLVLEANNMFRTWKVDVKHTIEEGTNTMEIRFLSPIQQGLEIYKALPYHVPCSANDLAEIGKVENNTMVSNLMRKAPYHFGWDWGPRLVTSGIWKDTWLKAWDYVSIKHVNIDQLEIGNNAVAKMNAVVEFDAIDKDILDDSNDLEIQILVNRQEVARVKMTIDPKTGQALVPFNISNAKLW